MARKRPPAPPEMPATTTEEVEMERQLLIKMQGLTAKLRQRNLDNAVLLAQQAARGHGPLVDHFQELGRRFGETLDAPPPKTKLRVVAGGAS